MLHEVTCAERTTIRRAASGPTVEDFESQGLPSNSTLPIRWVDTHSVRGLAQARGELNDSLVTKLVMRTIDRSAR